MGTHISKVKSTNLDVWQPQWLEFIESMGNDRVNLKYLSKRNPTPNVNSDSEMEEYIRNKYEKQLYSSSAIQGFADVSAKYSKELDTLASMGFVNQPICLDALKQSNGSIERAVEIIIANTPPSPKRGSPPELSQSNEPSYQAQLKALGFHDETINEKAFRAAGGNLEMAAALLYEAKAAESKSSQGQNRYQSASNPFGEVEPQAPSFSQRQQMADPFSQTQSFPQQSSFQQNSFQKEQQAQSIPKPQRQQSAADELFNAFAAPPQQSQHPQFSAQQFQNQQFSSQQFSHPQAQWSNSIGSNLMQNMGSRPMQQQHPQQFSQQSQLSSIPNRQQSAAEELFGAFAPSTQTNQSFTNSPFSGSQTAFNQGPQSSQQAGQTQNNFFADPQSFNQGGSNSTNFQNQAYLPSQQSQFQQPLAQQQQNNPFAPQPQSFQQENNPFGQNQDSSSQSAPQSEKRQIPKDSILSMYRAEPPRPQGFAQQQGYPMQSGYGMQQQSTFQPQAVSSGYQQQPVFQQGMMNGSMNQHNPFSAPIQPQYTGYNANIPRTADYQIPQIQAQRPKEDMTGDIFKGGVQSPGTINQFNRVQDKNANLLNDLNLFGK